MKWRGGGKVLILNILKVTTGESQLTLELLLKIVKLKLPNNIFVFQIFDDDFKIGRQFEFEED